MQMYPSLRRRSRNYQVNEIRERQRSPRRRDSFRVREVRFYKSMFLPRVRRRGDKEICHGERTIFEEDNEGDTVVQSDPHRLAKEIREGAISQQQTMLKYRNQEHQLRQHKNDGGMIKLELDRIRVMRTPEPIEDDTFMELEAMSLDSEPTIYPFSSEDSRRNSNESSKTLESSESALARIRAEKLAAHSAQCFACRLAARREPTSPESSIASASSVILPPLPMTTPGPRSTSSTVRSSREDTLGGNLETRSRGDRERGRSASLDKGSFETIEKIPSAHFEGDASENLDNKFSEHIERKSSCSFTGSRGHSRRSSIQSHLDSDDLNLDFRY